MLGKRKHQVTEENLIESSRYFDPIPIDLLINNIFSRLSSKSMGNCRCVSKLWSSIIRRPNYKELFPVKSPEPPRFLLTFIGGGRLIYYTSPQPQNPDYNSSLVATRHHSNPFMNSYRIFGPVHGLVCHQRTGKNYIVVVISNPITGEFVTLPKVTTKVVEARSYLGYDPIEKQFKVLCISLVHCGTKEKILSIEHQVLTLENGSNNLQWRKIQCCCKSLYDLSEDGICINGVLYYNAEVEEPMIGYFDVTSKRSMIGCFDVKSERLDFISRKRNSTLVNYKGKLGMVDNDDERNIVLWILEDFKEEKWSKHVYEIPLQWRKVYNIKSVDVYVAGVTDIGEVVFYPKHGVQVPFYIYYYNLEKNIVVKVSVEAPALKGYKWPKVNIFPNYVEEMKLM